MSFRKKNYTLAAETPIKPEDKPIWPENDLSALTFRDVKFGCRTGHDKELRLFAMNKFGLDICASLTDREIQERIFDEGYIPMLIYGNDDMTDSIYLVHKDVIKKSILIAR